MYLCICTYTSTHSYIHIYIHMHVYAYMHIIHTHTFTHLYHNLPVNSRSLYSSCPQIIASRCSANIVINAAAFIWPFQPNTLNSMEWLNCIWIYCTSIMPQSPFTEIYCIGLAISAMHYMMHTSINQLLALLISFLQWLWRWG